MQKRYWEWWFTTRSLRNHIRTHEYMDFKHTRVQVSTSVNVWWGDTSLLDTGKTGQNIWSLRCNFSHCNTEDYRFKWAKLDKWREVQTRRKLVLSKTTQWLDSFIMDNSSCAGQTPADLSKRWSKNEIHNAIYSPHKRNRSYGPMCRNVSHKCNNKVRSEISWFLDVNASLHRISACSLKENFTPK